ncbi:MAG: glycosyltransferase, partial [Bdellovibrionota bacterium]
IFKGALRRAGWPAESIARARVGLWRPLILHSHFGTSGWEALPLKMSLGIPLVTSFYGTDAWSLPTEQPIWRRRYAELFGNGDVFMVEGPAMRQRLVDLGCPADKVHVHRIGVRTDLFNFREKKFFEGLKIAMVGRFVEKKGFVDGLRACAKAVETGVNLSVTIIGDALSEDAASLSIKQQLSAIANSALMSGRVRFTGFLPQEKTRALLEEHNVLLCPSKHGFGGDAEGGSPVVLTESMAMGLLCIGSRHCDIPEVIVDRHTGYLFEEGNVMELASILRDLLDRPEKLMDLTLAGRRNVEEQFSLSRQLEALSQLYKKLLRQESGIAGRPLSKG